MEISWRCGQEVGRSDGLLEISQDARNVVRVKGRHDTTTAGISAAKTEATPAARHSMVVMAVMSFSGVNARGCPCRHVGGRRGRAGLTPWCKRDCEKITAEKPASMIAPVKAPVAGSAANLTSR